MLEHLRSRWTKVLSPLAALLLKAKITPDMVTWVGTIGVIAVSLICFPAGWLWQGTLLLLVFIFSDSFDGIMARMGGTSSDWGAFLDSCLDRVADGAVFGGLALYYVGEDYNKVWAALAIVALVCGQVTSYTKARGESLGYSVNGGLAGRSDRLLIGLLGAFLTGLGVHWALPAALVVLAVAGIVTVGQRMALVHGQMKGAQQASGTR
ncbi:CDP-diacylglycerol--glycerol-3-phosphate 3-phosphatidyltransferase [Propionibacterium cyclohexanicum]|uniref:Phosphatidylinositol phosphate synthase n=1 Tax=Propionibacterium cyclohexanicum TaxID=64702 RepID=A0A1H9QMS0_9ACTN|nr:CDP-alcohol phosphatidyltransferase family protein [Propionibacterium cyclohexanicum]SER61816.1 CDP-diacylglycerol--glycerol-3-phosphate 3-phosphatidyltransferase [Propionibacterium cyclohexanicum]